MTIEREVELVKGHGDVVHWKASGLDQIPLTIAPTVYPPREDSKLLDMVLAELGSGDGRRLLEIGCGSGAISISSSLRGWEVLSCDVNPLAVVSTLGNASENGCRLEVIEGGPGDGNAWIPDSGVDAIAWNLPYLEPSAGDMLGPLEDSALIGLQGDVELLKTLTERPSMLNKGGVVFLIHSSNSLGDRISGTWRKAGWATRNVHSIQIGDEQLTAIACWRPFEGSEIIRLKKCGSTNDEIMDMKNAPQGTLIISAEQDSGRGYRNRKWIGSKDNFMGSWKLHKKSINRDPKSLQYASTLAVLDTFSVFTNCGLPSHSWVNSSALEKIGIRVKWPNDIWFRTQSRIGKMCGILVQGRTKGDRTCVALGIGLNRCSVKGAADSIGWEEFVDLSLEEMIPVLHASISSTLECHPLVKELQSEEIIAPIFTAMRMTLCEGKPESFGITSDGDLYGVNQIRTMNEEWSWNWS